MQFHGGPAPRAYKSCSCSGWHEPADDGDFDDRDRDGDGDGRGDGRGDDDSGDDGDSRDHFGARYAARKGAGREHLAPQMPGGHRTNAWGGAMLRTTQVWMPPTLEGRQYYDEPGRQVPIGFARYVSPVVDPHSFRYLRRDGWRIAVPREAEEGWVRGLLQHVSRHGPQSAGYVRLGDTLVPAALGPGDRATIAESALDPAGLVWGE